MDDEDQRPAGDGDDASWPEQAGRIAETFGLGSPLAPLAWAANGEQGVIWRLDTEHGAYAVKELQIRQTEAAVAGDVAFQERAAARATTFEVARTMRTANGDVLDAVAGRQIRVQTWLEMSDPDPSIDPGAVGRMLAELHAVGDASTDEVNPWYTAPVGEARWQQLLDQLGAVGSPCQGRIADAVPGLVELEDLLVRPTGLRTCHRDLWADNVRWTPTGRLCVFDWDNCGPASPSHELGMLLYEFGLDSQERIGALADAYARAGGPGRVAAPGDLTMVIAQFGHFYEMAIQALLAPTVTPEDITWATGRLDMLEERPLTVDSIRVILAATTDSNS